MNFKKYTYFCLIIITFVSCTKKEKKFEEQLKDNLKRFTYKDAELFLSKHEEKLYEVTNMFLNEKAIQSIIRRTKSKSLLKNDEDVIKYSIITADNNFFYVTIKFDKISDEKNFWVQNLDLIKNDENPNVSLEKFIVENKIEKFSMIEILQFMRSYDIFRISKSSSNNFVKYNIELFDGLIYKASDKSVYGEIDSNIDIEILKNSWYYFKEPY